MKRVLIRGGLVIAEADSAPARLDVLVAEGRIAAVGAGLAVGPGETVIEAGQRLVIPGLVNAHTHTHNNLARSAIDGLPLELWLQRLGARMAVRTAREVYVGAALGALEMVRSGTTMACDMAQALPWVTDETLGAVVQAYLDVGLRAAIAPQILDRPSYEGLVGLAELLPAEPRAELDARPRPSAAELLGTIRRGVERWQGAGEGRIQVGVGPTIAMLCSQELLEGCAALAAERGLLIQTHLAESKTEAVTARAMYGRSFTAYLDQVGLLGPRTILAHGVWLDDSELDLLAERGCPVVHNPISNLKLGSGIAPLLALQERGCPVALGTDGSASNDSQNLFGLLRLAALLPRVETLEYERWPGAAEVFRMATVHGARAAGLEGEVGRIVPGYRADLTLLDLGATYYHPRNDLLRQVVFCETGSSVRTVLVDGRVVLDEGRITTVDEAALLAEADEIGERAAAEASARLASVERLEPYLRRAYDAATRTAWPVDRFGAGRRERVSG